MSDARRTRLNTELTAKGLSLTGALNKNQLEEVVRLVDSVGGEISKAADVTGTHCSVNVGEVSAPTKYVTITAVPTGGASASGVASVSVLPAGNDTLAVTNTSGAIVINLANTTGSKNTLTLIKAALDAASAGQYSTAITGTASQQVTGADATNTSGVIVPGGTAAGGVLASTLGVAQAGAFTVTPA